MAELIPAPNTDIAKLFADDPLHLTNANLDAIIAKMRESRGQFALGNMKAGSTKGPTGKTKQALDALAGVKLDLGGLDL